MNRYCAHIKFHSHFKCNLFSHYKTCPTFLTCQMPRSGYCVIAKTAHAHDRNFIIDVLLRWFFGENATLRNIPHVTKSKIQK